MWVILAVVSALCLGFYDIFKKISVRDNNVLMVLMLNTVFGALYMSPVVIGAVLEGNYGFGNTLTGHLLILLKSFIVFGSWLLGYFAIKHLPLTIQGPINASRPVMVLVGALVIFGEQLNPPPMDRYRPGLSVALSHLAYRCERGVIAATLQMDMDVDRSHRVRGSQRTLRQIPSPPLPTHRSAGMVFTLSVCDHGHHHTHNPEHQ